MEKIYYFFHHGILFLSYLLACLAMTNTNITTDQSSLLSLVAHITFDPDEILTKNWSVKSSVCEWVGVTCGPRHHRVTALNISNMGLTGTIPPQLGNLSFLVSLNMSVNNFHGELPPELANLRRLRILDFGVNSLTGVVPSRFGWLQKLQKLSLRNNRFTGPIPSSISNISDLEVLWLANNSLEGRIPIEIGNLQKLKYLNIINNQLSGSLPPVIFNISSLEMIGLTNNSLSGSLPVSVCDHLKKLHWLALGMNNLQSQIPSTLSNCSQLQVLWLWGNGFSGFIPREIGDLRMLEQLSLGYNNLNGSIPKDIGNLTMLKVLHIGENRIEEYGSEGLVSTRSDVYSFGIVLMETFLRVKPSDEIFSEDLNIKSWIEDSLHGATIQVIDANLLKPEDTHLTKKLEYISLILELALSCCKECPVHRMSMKDVVVALVKIKHQLLSVCGDQI